MSVYHSLITKQFIVNQFWIINKTFTEEEEMGAVGSGKGWPEPVGEDPSFDPNRSRSSKNPLLL